MMWNLFDRIRRIVLLSMPVVLVSVLSGAGVVRAEATGAVCEGTWADGTMTESTYKTVSRAIEDMGNDRLVEAAEGLQSIRGKVEGYELAMVLQTLGYVEVRRDRMDEALQVFEQALATGALPRQAHEDLMLNTGQLYLAGKNLDQGISRLLEYLDITCREVPREVYLALASAYTEKQDYTLALEWIDTVIGMAERPEEAWLQLKLALHYELRDYPQSAATLLDLIVLVPGKQEYWRQLSGVLLQIDRTEDALAVLAVAAREGFLTSEGDIKNLANLYLMLEIPWKAASVLDDGLRQGVIAATADNYRLLSEAWIGAYEWEAAETALAEAARLSGGGALWQQLARVRMEKEDWEGARTALERALEQGVDDEGETRYLLGIAAYYSGNRRAAITAMRQAGQFGIRARESRQWLDHLISEERAVAESATPP